MFNLFIFMRSSGIFIKQIGGDEATTACNVTAVTLLIPFPILMFRSLTRVKTI